MVCELYLNKNVHTDTYTSNNASQTRIQLGARYKLGLETKVNEQIIKAKSAA